MPSTPSMAAFAFKYWLHDVPSCRLWRDRGGYGRHLGASIVFA